MSNPGGIAGAMDYQPATQAPALACIVCGAEIHGGMKGSPSARAEPGIGIIHACSKACAADARFAEPLPTRAEVPTLRAERDAAVAELNRERVQYKDDMDTAIVEVARWSQRSQLLNAEATTLRARVAELEAALQPFAAIAGAVPDETPDGAYLHETVMVCAATIGMCRIARAALGGTDNGR